MGPKMRDKLPCRRNTRNLEKGLSRVKDDRSENVRREDTEAVNVKGEEVRPKETVVKTIAEGGHGGNGGGNDG
ncbi:hypothetical protein F2Q68_00011256 [Brassica cretica]|uniref:Uncharacterized protein n=1 Tax=Brassica cretica TaxID=69181 RepID=A0A8S9KPA6_BRACR|nr:hypothetical protein F2Q68_00011256 [Brassica cretica]